MPPSRDIALYVLLLLMEITSTYAIVVDAGFGHAVPLGLSIVALLLFAAIAGAFLSVLASALNPPEAVSRTSLLIGGALVSAGLAVGATHGISAQAAVALLAGIAYWRGLSVSAEQPSYDDTSRRFGLGYGLMFVGLAWTAVWGSPSHASQWVGLAVAGIAYTLIGMTALALSRLDSHSEATVERAVAGSLAVQMLAFILFAAVALEVFSIDVVGALSGVLAPLGALAGAVIVPILRVVLWPLVAFANLFRHGHQSPQRHPNQVARHPPAAHHATGSLPVWATTLEVVVAAVVVVAAIAFLWRSVPRAARRRRPARRSRERERASSIGSIWAALVAWLAHLFHRGSAVVTEAAASVRTRVLGPPLADDPIRRAYARTLRRAAGAGLARSPGTTCLDFQRDFTERWPEGARDFASLTHAYVRRRYGEVPVGPTEARESEACATRLRAILRG